MDMGFDRSAGMLGGHEQQQRVGLRAQESGVNERENRTHERDASLQSLIRLESSAAESAQRMVHGRDECRYDDKEMKSDEQQRDEGEVVHVSGND